MCCICKNNFNGLLYGTYFSEEEGRFRRKFCDDCELFECTAKELKPTRFKNKNSLITPEEQVNNFEDYLPKDPKERIVKAINFMLLNYKSTLEPHNMGYEAAELKIATEMFGVEDVCVIYVDTNVDKGDYRLRLLYTGGNKEENNERRTEAE